MDDELLKTLMESVDPARDLSDETLHELLPDDQLMARITAGISAESLEAVRVKPTPFWRRVPTLVGASAAALLQLPVLRRCSAPRQRCCRELAQVRRPLPACPQAQW